MCLEFGTGLTQRREEHANCKLNTQKPVQMPDSDSGHRCCEATVLATMPPCCQEVFYTSILIGKFFQYLILNVQNA